MRPRNDAPSELFDPDRGEVTIVLPFAPVRFKAARARKDILTKAVRRITSKIPDVLSGEVTVDIEWLIHERERCESHASPDLDNILKPLLDALHGPRGILIDDSQIQALGIHWIDSPREEQTITIRIRHLPDELIPKAGLLFARVHANLCVPLNMNLPPRGLLVLIDNWEAAFRARGELLRSGMNYYGANRVMPIQRPFHSSRLRSFKIRPLAQLRTEVCKRIGSRP